MSDKIRYVPVAKPVLVPGVPGRDTDAAHRQTSGYVGEALRAIPRRPRPDLGRGQPHQCELAIALSAQRTRALARLGTAAHSHAQGCARAGASGTAAIA